MRTLGLKTEFVVFTFTILRRSAEFDVFAVFVHRDFVEKSPAPWLAAGEFQGLRDVSAAYFFEQAISGITFSVNANQLRGFTQSNPDVGLAVLSPPTIDVRFSWKLALVFFPIMPRTFPR